jgi:hypothetical protein
MFAPGPRYTGDWRLTSSSTAAPPAVLVGRDTSSRVLSLAALASSTVYCLCPPCIPPHAASVETVLAYLSPTRSLSFSGGLLHVPALANEQPRAAQREREAGLRHLGSTLADRHRTAQLWVQEGADMSMVEELLRVEANGGHMSKTKDAGTIGPLERTSTPQTRLDPL